MQDFGVDESTLEYEPTYPSESPFAGAPEALEGFEGFGAFEGLEGFEGFGELPSPFAGSTAAVPGGRYVLTHHPVLRHHRGTPPDLILRWNAMPAGTTTVDVVVHLHGYSGRGVRLRLQDKEPISGLDFADPANPSRAGRTRPTLALLPRGNFFGGRYGNGYNFPELVKPGALTRLVADGLALLAQQTGVTPVLGRLVLTGHSGGGAPVTAILRHTDPDEVHVFDGLYSDATAMIAWASKRIAGGSVGSALRVLYRPGTGTQAESKRVQREIVKMLTDSSNGRAMAPYFRVEATRTEHNDIPPAYGWQLLADVASDLPGATPGAAPRQEAAQEWEGLDPAGEGYDEAGEGFDPEGEGFDPESEAFDVESFEPESSGWTDLESESRRRPLTTSALRRAWAAYQCAGERMVPLRLLSHRTPVNPLTVEAFTALGAALLATSYQARSTWVYNCRSIRQVDPTRQPQASLHAYGLAVDIDPKWNPHRRHVTEPIRYSPATTLEQRIADVAAARAGTVFTPAQVAAVEAIRTVDGLQVFRWGGRWRDSHDAMHFQIAVTPAELARGLAAAGSAPPGEAPGEMETCEAWENESPAEAEYEAGYESEYLETGEQGGQLEGWRDLELPEATEARWGLYEAVDSAWSRTEQEQL